MAQDQGGPASQILLKGAFDAKKPVPEEVKGTIFGYIQIVDGMNEEVDSEDLIGRTFQVVGADTNRVYLEEVFKVKKAKKKGAGA